MIPSGPALRFLVVEDDQDVRDALARMVERLGHHADRACDGVQAIEALAVERYDYVLLDLAMPRMGGEDVMRWLREHPRWAAGLRVVVVTALARDHRRRLEALGAHAVLEKPLHSDQLRDLLARTHAGEVGELRRPA